MEKLRLIYPAKPKQEAGDTMSEKARDHASTTERAWESFPVPGLGDKGGGVNVALTSEDSERLKRWCGRLGLDKSAYVRWLCHIGPRLRMIPQGVKLEED
jgi:hypothetical protein